MPASNAREMLKKATRDGYAIGAFNVTNLVQFRAVVGEANARNAPVIVQTSVTPSRFFSAEVWVAIYRAIADAAGVPVCLHLDHCPDADYCRRCADAGYTNIMIDASAQSYEENVRQTAEVSSYVHRNSDATVEGELGRVVGVEDELQVKADESTLCDPETAVDFVKRTGVDLFAPAIGTAHGVYKTSDPRVDIDRFAAIRQRLLAEGMEVPLVVHGGTGLPETTVRRLVELGGAKFNVSTELKRTMIDSMYGYVNENREEYNPGRIDAAVTDAIRETVGRWMETLGSAGKA